MTWRLGILFTMLSAREEAIDDYTVQDTTKLIRLFDCSFSDCLFQ